MAEDLDVFFNGQEFATPAWVGKHLIMSLVSQTWVNDQAVHLPRTTLTCSSQAVLDIRSGETLLLGEAQAPYRVVNLQPDGTGLTVFILEKI